MYELYILGELMDHQQLHGYLLQNILNRIVGPVRSISWGVLYPLIHELEENGYIEQVHNVPTEGRGRKKKTYQITEAGKSRFHRLMEQPIEYKPEYELHFYTKLANFSHVNEEVKFTIYYQYRDYLKSIRRHLEEQIEYLSSREDMEFDEKENIFSIFTHRQLTNDISMEWLTRQVEELTETKREDE